MKKTAMALLVATCLVACPPAPAAGFNITAGRGVRLVSPSHHWFASEQIATTSTRTDALSSRFEFMTSGGWQDGPFTVMLRHVSNAHILGGGENLGETMLLAGVHW